MDALCITRNLIILYPRWNERSVFVRVQDRVQGLTAWGRSLSLAGRRIRCTWSWGGDYGGNYGVHRCLRSSWGLWCLCGDVVVLGSEFGCCQRSLSGDIRVLVNFGDVSDSQMMLECLWSPNGVTRSVCDLLNGLLERCDLRLVLFRGGEVVSSGVVGSGVCVEFGRCLERCGEHCLHVGTCRGVLPLGCKYY